MATQLVKVKGMRVGPEGKPVETEDLMPVPSSATQPVSVNIQELSKLIAYAKAQGWI
jgi:hypothetical protein